MSDFPSINSLLQSSGQASQPNDSKTKKTIAGDKTAEEKFSSKMKEMDIKSKEDETMRLAAQLGLPHINLVNFPVSSESLRIIPEETAKEKKMVCFFFTIDEARLGCVDHSEEMDEIAFQIGERHHTNVKLYLISENSFEKVLKLYQNLPIVKPINKDINITDDDLAKFEAQVIDFRGLAEQFINVPITDVLTLMIAAALKVNASDIHVEAEEKGIVVRYRIDGVLQDVAELPKEQWKKIISRIKLLAQLKINIDDKPQDGRVTLKLSASDLDVRVSTMPTIHGESVVMRILYGNYQGVDFEELGLRGDAYEKLKKEVSRPNGMIIATGPTGSGKTTTMYSILRQLNKPGVKIITLEDPVEIKLEGINQSQVDQNSGYTFAKGLRSLLRQDPDICMVGEIRDLETAEIAIQAALTGHLMLSTIHTNNAAGAIPRFLSMGVKPFLLAPSLNCVVGQRLVRRVCEACLEEEKLTPERDERIKKLLTALPANEKDKIDLENLHFYKGKGCDACSGLGYKGRIGVYEIFIMNKEIEEAILRQQPSEYLVTELAAKQGMITMAQDGLLKALDKLTTVDEVFRVTE
jgi:type IV pilus assembly protein PilB